MITLGIETSCDETALALIETKGTLKAGDFEIRVIASLIHSQAELHSAYGGVFPMLAKREHAKNLIPLLEKLLARLHLDHIPMRPTLAGSDLARLHLADVLELFRPDMEMKDPDLFASLKSAAFLNKVPEIDQIAVTEGPGLEPTLWVGINFAQFLGKFWSASRRVPIIPINHMEGHIVGSLLPSDITNSTAGGFISSGWQKLHKLPIPAVAFLISGGHTELIKVTDIGQYEIIGQTRDDAVGEAFDKVARLLGLPYPGGPHVSKLAGEAKQKGIISTVKLPRPMITSKDLDFSFAGLKTAVLYAIREEVNRNRANSSPDSELTNSPLPKNTDASNLSDDFKKSLCLEFQNAVVETLDVKLRKAIEQIGALSIIVGGGVSANHELRKSFQLIADEYGIPLFLPSLHISGDNALMIALAGALDNSEANSPITKPSASLKAHGTKKLGQR